METGNRTTFSAGSSTAIDYCCMHIKSNSSILITLSRFISRLRWNTPLSLCWRNCNGTSSPCHERFWQGFLPSCCVIRRVWKSFGSDLKIDILSFTTQNGTFSVPSSRGVAIPPKELPNDAATAEWLRYICFGLRSLHLGELIRGERAVNVQNGDAMIVPIFGAGEICPASRFKTSCTEATELFLTGRLSAVRGDVLSSAAADLPASRQHCR